jgi:hypothetical protein
MAECDMRHQEPFEAPGVTGAAPPRSAGRPATFTEKAAGLVRRLADILASPNALRPPEPVVPRIAWAGRVTLLAAREKLGKTTLAAAAAAAVSTGSPWLNERVTPGDVLWTRIGCLSWSARRRTSLRYERLLRRLVRYS